MLSAGFKGAIFSIGHLLRYFLYVLLPTVLYFNILLSEVFLTQIIRQPSDELLYKDYDWHNQIYLQIQFLVLLHFL